jgi:hypothetical protein
MQRNVCIWVNNGRRWSALRMTQVADAVEKGLVIFGEQ